jgi:putative hemolysin
MFQLWRTEFESIARNFGVLAESQCGLMRGISAMALIARRFATPASAAARWQLSTGRYQLALADSHEDIHSALRLRYRVFNLELQEGLASSHGAREDRDEFDDVMRHLIVRDNSNGDVVGTYRLQTGSEAARGLGYYSAREFDFTPYEGRRCQIVELGRACIDAQHRNMSVLSLLWRGIAVYAKANGCHLLLGCSSLTSQDEEEGLAAYRLLFGHQVSPDLRTSPMPAFALSTSETFRRTAKIPKLLRAYLSLGAMIAGPPAIDREFKTIDFLTILDLRGLPVITRSRFLV